MYKRILILFLILFLSLNVFAVSYTSQYPPAFNTTYVKVTSIANANYNGYLTTDPSKSLTGTWINNSWLSNGASNQRFHIDLGEAKTIINVYYENGHTEGGSTTNGAQNFTMWGSNTSTSFDDTTYATDTGWTQLTTSISAFEQHAETDTADPKYFTVTNTTPYRYYAFKIADNYGGADYISLRRIELQTLKTFITADFNSTINILDTNIQFIDTTYDTNNLINVNLTDWNWYVNTVLVSTDQNWTKTGVSEYQDYNVALSVSGTYDENTYTSYTEKTVSTGKWFGDLNFVFYDDTTETTLTEVYLEFDGTPYYSDTNDFIIINLHGITSGTHSLLMQVTGYQEKSFNLTLNEFSDINYNMGFVSSSNLSDVAFQVFTLTGTTKPNTTFFGYDNDNNFLISVKKTGATGLMNFYLNNAKSEYNFISTDLNFGTTTWTLNKPKDAITLNDINYLWQYSITGNSYSSATNIVSGVTKLLLQNTVNPYYINIQDVSNAYYPTSFGLQSVTSETTKTLNPYLYPIDSADLVLIKLLDFSTNQPISTFEELQLSLYTDSNGLLEIGTFINDSTGTYNIYMDANAKYQLIVSDQTFILSPTLSIYYLYLTQASGLQTTNDVNVIANPFVDLNSPTIFLEVRQFFFGCSAETENCYASMVFSLIAIVILAIGFSAYLTVGSLEQSILIVILLGVFTFTSFIPLWLFAITAVIAIMWGVFS